LFLVSSTSNFLEFQEEEEKILAVSIAERYSPMATIKEAKGVAEATRRPRALPRATMTPRISRRIRRNTGRFHRREVVADGHKEAKGVPRATRRPSHCRWQC
jgi:hypothetical protein